MKTKNENKDILLRWRMVIINGDIDGCFGSRFWCFGRKGERCDGIDQRREK